MNAFLKIVLKKPLALAALVWITLLVIAAFTAQYVLPFDPLDQDLLGFKQLPSAEHWLGTDGLGRDVLSRLMASVQITVLGIVQALGVLALLAVALGVTAGYFGGWWEKLVLQWVSLTQAMPVVFILLVVLAVFGQSMLVAMVTLGVMASGGTAQVIRSVTLNVREELYIAAARVSGLPDLSIITRHVLPRITGPVIVQLSIFAAVAVIVQTGISFLGLGVPPPAPTWGGMIAEAAATINDFPWLLVPSGGVVAITILSFGLLGDSLRDASTESWTKPSKRQNVKVREAVMPTDIPAGAVVSLRNVTITAGSEGSLKTLVNNLSLDVKAGECMGIVGESGSGKTMTILALMGLLPVGVQVATGTAVVAGEVIDLTNLERLKALRGRVLGMIFQEPMAALDPCFTIEYQLAEVLKLRGNRSKTQIKAKVIDLLEQVKIPNAADVAVRYPHQISGGMAQRVGIARALASEPQILLADEPTTALDVTVQAEVLALLRSLSVSRNMAVILVTHDWGVVADICQNAMVLRHGEVLETADVVDLFHRPQHAYTKALLAANPHSAVPGQPLPTITDMMEATA